MIGDESRDALQRFLATDPRDAGCEQTLEAMHVYAELVASGEDPEQHYPGIAVHLRTCKPCAEDLTGLLSVMGVELDER